MFTSIPIMSGTFESNALAKNITLKASATGKHTAKLTWNKCKSPNSGYAVFRDFKAIGHYNTKKTSFYDSGLASASGHWYQIKTYKKSKKTQWYNKKTGNWQSKKPAKKYRGKSRKITTYSYKKSSNAVYIMTDFEFYTITWKNWNGNTLGTSSTMQGMKPVYYGVTPTRPSDDNYTYTFKGWTPTIVEAHANKTYTATYTATAKPTIPAPTNLKYSNLSSSSVTLSWTAASVSGTPSYKLYRKDGNGNTKVTPVSTTSAKDTSVVAGTTYQYYVTTIYNGQESVKSNMIMVKVPSETATTQTKTVTDYTGRTFQIYKNSNESFWRYTSNDVAVESMPKIDKTVDGEFDIGSNHMIQYHGATFNATAIKNAKPKNYDYIVDMYNGEASKLSIELQDGVYVDWIDTYKEVGNHKYEPTVKYYYFKNGHPIAMPVQTDGQFVYKTETSGNITKKHFYVDNAAMSVGDAVGIWTDVFNVYVKYDGKLIETITIDTARDENLGTSWTSQTANGMSPWRRVALNIAEQAISSKGGSTGKLYQDLHLISDYIDEHYTYGEEVPVYGTTMPMKCIAGAIVLETYSIVHYNKYGFESSGSNYYDGNHSAFNLNEDPQTYYEANGHITN